MKFYLKYIIKNNQIYQVYHLKSLHIKPNILKEKNQILTIYFGGGRLKISDIPGPPTTVPLMAAQLPL